MPATVSMTRCGSARAVSRGGGVESGTGGVPNTFSVLWAVSAGMADLDVPPAPDVTNRQVPTALEDADADLEDLRRGEIETALREGAWREGFEEWSSYVDLDEAALDLLYDRDLFPAFDFYYDPEADSVRAVPPALPEDWVAETPSPAAAALRTALDDLGEIVAETLARDYLDWAASREGDYVWREETFGTVEGEPGSGQQERE